MHHVHRALMFLTLVCLALVAGCDKSPPPQRVIVTQPVAQPAPVPIAAPAPAAAAPSTIMHANDLDLAYVSGAIQNGSVRDALGLQNMVNTTPGVNNVDLDKDGLIDPITVSEATTPTGKQFNLVANPATQPATTVANIAITNAPTGYAVSAGYPAYVAGYDSYYYNYHASRDLAFLMWAYSMNRPIYVAQPYGYYGYAPRPVYSPGVIAQTRQTTQTTTRVSPVQKTAPPPAAVQQAQATKVPSGFKPSANAAPAPTTNNLNDRGQAKSFTERDSAKPVQPATGFGAKPATPTPPPAAAPTTQRSPSTTPPSAPRTSPPSVSPPSTPRSSPPSAPRTSPPSAPRSSPPSAPRTSPGGRR